VIFHMCIEAASGWNGREGPAGFHPVLRRCYRRRNPHRRDCVQPPRCPDV
jgi:hypothetical protein